MFDLQVVKHFNHLTLRNGVSLAGLGREPRDLEVFFRTAVFFISEAGAFTSLQKEAFIERLTEFLSAHARWLKARPMDVYEAMCGCGFVGEQNGECVWKLEVCEPVGNVSKVLAAWAHFDEARVRRRSKMRALLQAKNRAVNALPAPKIDPELDAELMLQLRDGFGNSLDGDKLALRCSGKRLAFHGVNEIPDLPDVHSPCFM